MSMRVGFIGLGSQGGPMARRIVEAGYPLTLWARRPEVLEEFADTAASLVSTPADLGGASDLVGVCVVADADVEAVLTGPQGVLAGMAPGGIVAIHSTVHPETCRRLAGRAEERGVAVVDAPVSGGGGAARERGLVVMVGGDAEHVGRCRPVFETFGDPVIHLGPLGSGQVAKLVNNLVFTAQLAVAAETFSLGERLGLDRAALAQVLVGGSGGSRAAAILAGGGFDLTGLRGAAPLLQKDVGIIRALIDDLGAGRPLGIDTLAREALGLLAGPAGPGEGIPANPAS